MSRLLVFSIIIVLALASPSSLVRAQSCSVATDCSGHATSVSGSPGSCVCTCRNQWSGNDCATCDPIFNKSLDCGACAVHRGHYPTCALGCNNADYCNGRAVTDPSGTAPDCACVCRNGWTTAPGSAKTDQCNLCPLGLDVSQNCGACLKGYAVNSTSPKLTCSLKCTVANCSYHATSVTGTSWTGCSCTCRNAWDSPNSSSQCSKCPNYWNPDPDCVTCFPGYSGPNCLTRVCDVIKDCNNHAVNVSGDPGSCVCNCRNQWSGSACATCPAGVQAGTDCDRCLPGYGPGVPDCRPVCTTANDCNGNNAVSTVGYRPNCTCNCRNKFTGAKCATCPDPYAGAACNTCKATFSGYPNCALSCTTAANCSGQATSVSGNILTGCTCSCRNKWSGANCSTCAAKYDKAQDCGKCAAGFDTYSSCYQTCTVQTDCSGHALSVSGNYGPGGCTCSCYGHWSGSKCGACPVGMNQTATDATHLGCDRCIDGWSGFPACSRTCQLSDCNNHAMNVSGNTPHCTCGCRNQWKGESCGVCGELYNKSNDCGSCVGGATGYPNCYRDCDVTLDCSGNAASVTGQTYGNSTGCTCKCRNGWTGARCSACADKYNAGNDCGSCNSPLYGGIFPNCAPVCSNGIDCSGRAVNVSGLRPNCSCSCKDQWAGKDCSTCPSNFAQSTCKSCASGYANYPTCAPLCTVAADCSNHASSVSGTRDSGCTCNCRYMWNGTKCESCPSLYTQSTCSSCVSGRVHYPRCALPCDAATVCSSHGTVHGDQDVGCTCTCRYSWMTNRTINQNNKTFCESCPATIDDTRDCRYCKPGYTNYPYCYRICTSELDCNGHASSVTGTVASGCTCTCRNRWRGYDCNFCAGRYNRSDDCNSCTVSAVQFSFPRCYYTCSDANCSADRTRVQPKWWNTTTSSWRYGCRCNCNSPGTCTGADSICAPGWPAWNNCSWVDSPCNLEVDCSNHASNVTGSIGTTCNCACRNQWVGAAGRRWNDCSVCPAQYDASRDCKYCSAGYSGTYPNCYRNCENARNCSGNAYKVTGNDGPGGCHCYCQHRWSSSDCSVCPYGYDASKNCAACITGWSGYGTCSPLCTIAGNCSGNALSVNGIWRTGCSCSCKNEWKGSSCQTCPTGVDSNLDCAGCLPGYDGYPQCSPKCTNSGDCSNHAANVSGIARTGCTCTCRNGWAGTTCSGCPANFNVSADCGKCNDGYHGYASRKCVRTCTIENDCSGKASNVSGDGSVGCTCNCTNQWRGSNCNQCPVQFDSSKDCGACAPGYVGTFPVCLGQCNISYHCSGHATSVSGDTSHGCVCACSNAWTGTKCDRCPSTVVQDGKCDRCATFFTGYPYCRRACTTSGDCNDHATSVSGFLSWNTSCTCSCLGMWRGANCATCPPQYDPTIACAVCNTGYEGFFPDCNRKCTTTTDCSNHAYAVTGNNKTGCTCSCSNKWYSVGANTKTGSWPGCTECAAKYNQGTCNSCLPGYEDFPFCYKSCTISENCGGTNRAVNVTGNNNTGCSCGCRNQWSGANCSVCADVYVKPLCGSCRTGLQNYPVCNRQCTLALDCSSHATSVSGTTQAASNGAECNCSCKNSWYGSHCDKCPATLDDEKDCGVCKQGYDTYPSCYLTCTGKANCSNHASVVTGNEKTGCVCTCINRWRNSGFPKSAPRFNKPGCDECPYGVDATNSNCGACSKGFTNFPNCSRDCEFADCTNHAISVEGDTFRGCACTCRNQWKNASCGRCDVQFNPSEDCGACNVGFSGIPPACTRPCSIKKDCADRATSVSGVWTDCQCACRNKWSLPRCQTCPWPYDPAKDCGACLPFFDGEYPTCHATCTVQRNCSDHADHVSRPSFGSCSCACRNHWSGPDCSRCGTGYNKSNDCLPNGVTPAPSTSSTTTTTHPPPPPSTTTTTTSTTTTMMPTTTSTSATSTSTTTSSTQPPTTTTSTRTTTASTTLPAPTTTLPTTTTATPSTSSSTTLAPTTTTSSTATTSTSTSTSTTTSTTVATTQPSTTAAATSSTSTTSTTVAAPTSTTSTATPPQTTTSVSTSQPQTTTTTATPTTTTAVCTIQSNGCSTRGTSGASVDPTSKKCTCNCKNRWGGASGKCDECPSWYNASKDCNACAWGFVDMTRPQSAIKPDCRCERHVLTTVTLPAPNPKPLPTVTQAIVNDMKQMVIQEGKCLGGGGGGSSGSSSSSSSSSSLSMTASVFSVSNDQVKDTYTMKTDVMLQGSSASCVDVRAAANCVKNSIRTDCAKFPRSVQALGGTANETCIVVVAALLMDASTSPCGGDGTTLCAAAAAIETTATTPAPPGDDGGGGAPIGAIIGGIVGGLLLIALLIFLKKRGYWNSGKSRRVDSVYGEESSRFNRAFNIGDQATGEDLMNIAADQSNYMDVRPNRCNTQFLADEIFAAAGAAGAAAAGADAVMSPKEQEVKNSDKAPAAEDDVYNEMDSKPRRKRGITMSFI